jgi:O-antigen/teichoic acid export membrane protein
MPLSWFYNNSVITVLYVLTVGKSVQIVADPFKGPIQEEFKLRHQGVADLTSIVIASITAIVLALNGYGLWSLVAFYIIQDILMSIFIIMISPRYPSVTFKRATARWFLGFAKGMLSSKMLNVAEDRADDYLVGTLASQSILGLYRVAWQIAWGFATISQQALSMGINPTFSQLQNDPKKSREGLEFINRMQLNVAMPVYIAITVAATEIVRVTFGSQWLEAVPMLRILILSGILIPILATGRLFYYARGSAETVISIQKYYLSVMLISMLVLIPLFSGIGAAVAVALTQLSGTVVLFSELNRDIDIRISQIFLRPTIASAFSLSTSVLVYSVHLSSIGPITTVCLTSLTVVITYYGCIYLVDRERIRSDIQLLFRGFQT